jgi:SAM-dependent methyltransferase
MLTQAKTGNELSMTEVHDGLRGAQWGLDRVVAVSYGVVYDYIFDHFPPYQGLRDEVRKFVESAVPANVSRSNVRVLEICCGTGNFSLMLAEAGFTVLGTDPYSALVDLAREKRRVRGLANASFQHADVIGDRMMADRSFDLVVNVHSLYVHPAPRRVLQEAFRVLRPGGHALFVNHTRRVGVAPTFRALKQREGTAGALRSLLWTVPNAMFETSRRQIGPHYWNEEQFERELQHSGFRVLEMRRTFLNANSLLVWAKKDAGS